MNLFIDKSNILAYIRSPNDKIKKQTDWLLKNKLIIRFNFTKEDAWKDDNIRMFLTEFISEGQSLNKNHFDANLFPPRPIENQSFVGNVCRRSIFLLEDVGVCHYKSKGSVLIGDVGEEIQLLSSILFKDKLHKNLSIGRTFKKWGDLELYNMPLTDIVIVDRELVKASKEDESVKYNITGLLTGLMKGKNVKPNIVLFTYIDDIWTFDVLDKLFKKAVHEFSSNGLNFTLVASSKPNKKGTVRFNSERIGHDRNIISNYLRISLKDSIPNFFLSSDNSIKTTSNDIDIYSIAEKEYLDTIIDIQLDLQRLINAGKCSVYGAKQSNFLVFQ